MKFLLGHLLSVLVVVGLTSAQQSDSDVSGSNPAQVDVRFVSNKIKLEMDNSTRIYYSIIVNKAALAPEQRKDDNLLFLNIQPITLSPQFDIIEFNASNSNQHELVEIPIHQLKRNNFIYNSSISLRATYIGHATLKLSAYINDPKTEPQVNESLTISSDINKNRLEITVIRPKGILDDIFMYSVIIFITISYINLGAQIDTDNVRRLIETPRIIFFGFLIGVVVMPSASWIAGHIFFNDQPMYRIGSFIYACGPAASASVLWTVMFDSDKELSLGLQIASTVGALITMPILLYAMDKSIDLEGQYTVKVPYMNLGRTLIVLLIALLVGSRLVGRSKRAKQISQRIFRPLTMFVLIFIIVFSSIVYWYIYKMFDWNITLMALVVTSVTYILSGLLGYLIHRDVDQMIAISISSTYRNSGIAFAALVVAFQPPDIFIAYVPCLTQVVTTSLIGLVLYSIKSVMKRCNKDRVELVAE